MYMQYFAKVVCKWRQCTLHVCCCHQGLRIRIRKGSKFIEFTDLDLYSEYGPRIQVLKLHSNFANCMRKRPQKLSANLELCEKGWGRSQIVEWRESLALYKSFNIQWCNVYPDMAFPCTFYSTSIALFRICIPFFFKYFFGGFFSFCSYNIQHCFICRPSDSTVPTDAGIEPRTVATCALAVRRSNH